MHCASGTAPFLASQVPSLQDVLLSLLKPGAKCRHMAGSAEPSREERPGNPSPLHAEDQGEEDMNKLLA